MPHIFISYARPDQAFAHALKVRLQAANFEVWTDQDIPPGQEWQAVIDEAIKASFVVVVVTTPHASRSEYVLYEWSFALGVGLRVIPLLLERTEPTHPRLAALHWVDFVPPAEQKWDGLIALLEQVRAEMKHGILPPYRVAELVTDFGGQSNEFAKRAARHLQAFGLLRARDNPLRGLKAPHANLHGARLLKAVLENMDLHKANLQHADFRYARLTDVNLQRANLTRADLRYSRLTRVDLTDALLDHALIFELRVREVILPDGTLSYRPEDFARFTDPQHPQYWTSSRVGSPAYRKPDALNIRRVELADSRDLQPLLQYSLSEGYDFIHKLWTEYQSGVNRFDSPGAALLAGYLGEQLIAVGGVHPDPYLGQPTIGRVRHVYVLPSHRRAGAGRQLLAALIEQARSHFDTLTLRTNTAHGDAFYRAIGFDTEPRFADATHWMQLDTEP